MKSLVFFLVLFGVAFIAWNVSSQKDGFQDVPPEGASPGPTIPLISPRYQTLTTGEVKPFTELSATLLSPPPGQIASVNALPSEDPALQKADAKRIQSVYESMKGFFLNDAPGLQKMGDPSVQLPLSTSKSDLARLRDELDVIKKNPGLDSSLTQDDVNGIEANLGYLQKKWRLAVNSGVGAASPMLPEEGFTDGATSSAYGWFRSFFGGNQEGFQATTAQQGTNTGAQGTGGTNTGAQGTGGTNTGAQGTGGTNTGAQGTGGTGTGGTGTGGTGTGGTGTGGTGTGGTGRGGTGTGGTGTGGTGTGGTGTGGSNCVTMSALEDLKLKLNIEKLRMGASGATDSVTQSRISLLNSIQQVIESYISAIRSGLRKPCDIPLTLSGIAEILPVISNPNSNLNELIKPWGMKSVLQSLFPAYSSGDISGSQVAQGIFDTYMKNISNNLSWDVALSYKGQAEQDISTNYALAMKDARYIVDTNGTPAASNSPGLADSAGVVKSSPSDYRGVFSSVISSLTGQNANVNVGMGSTRHTDMNAEGSSSHPGGFDWKTRSVQICNQITTRGMKAYDFGCLANPDSVSEDFSWRGYARMVCTRLGTVYDPSIPELCGCPPPSWAGWRP